MQVSIIVPTNNSIEILDGLLTSFLNSGHLLQYEIIFVDNKSDDGTYQRLLKFKQDMHCPVKIISEKDNGISDAFNKGIRIAIGEYILILGSDDELVEGWENLISKQIETQKDVISFSMVHVCDDKSEVHSPPKSLEALKSQMCIPHPSTIVKNKVCKDTLFSEKYKLAMDYDFFLRVFQKKATYCCSEDVLTLVSTKGVSHRNYMKSLIECSVIKKDLKIRFSTIMLISHICKFIIRRGLEFLGLDALVALYRKHFSINRKTAL